MESTKRNAVCTTTGTDEGPRFVYNENGEQGTAEFDVPQADVSGGFVLKHHYLVNSEGQSIDENGNVAIINSAGHPVYIDSSGKQDLFVTDLDITGAKDGKLYGILMAYEFSGSLYPIQGSVVYIRTVTSGVEDVATDEASLLKRQGNRLVASGNALIEVYNTSGMLVCTAEGEFDLTTLGSGLYIARANGATLKLIL